MSEMRPGSSRLREVEDSLQGASDFFELYYEQGWTDGLPVLPPTQAAVAAMLRYTDRAPDEVAGIIPPRNGAATIEKIAINAVMAGCRPEYCRYSWRQWKPWSARVQPLRPSDHDPPGAHLLIVHGPLRNELDVNCRQNVFGHGWRANAPWAGRCVSS